MASMGKRQEEEKSSLKRGVVADGDSLHLREVRESDAGTYVLRSEIGLAMRLRIHAVHADDPHMRICASRCACKNLDAHQPHIEQKRVLQEV